MKERAAAIRKYLRSLPGGAGLSVQLGRETPLRWVHVTGAQPFSDAVNIALGRVPVQMAYAGRYTQRNASLSPDKCERLLQTIRDPEPPSSR